MKKNQTDAMKDLLYKMSKISFASYIYRTELLRSESISFDEDLKYGEDREFNWKYLANCNSCFCVEDTLYYYRLNNESATRKKSTWKNIDALVSVDRTYHYLRERKCEFADEYYRYMYARSMWHVAKNFAVSREKGLFKKLVNEYDVKSCMKVTKKDQSFLVRVASILFLINPYLFYFFVGLKK